MSDPRHVPLIAVLTGLVLAGTFLGFALYATGDLVPSTLLGALLLAPFAAYALANADAPVDRRAAAGVVGLSLAGGGAALVTTLLNRGGPSAVGATATAGLVAALALLFAAAYRARER